MKQLIITSIFTMPTLTCLIAVCITDLKSRIVPRLWIILATLLQSFANLAYSIILRGNISLALFCWISCAIVFVIYLIMQKLAPPNSIGFGDVTCAAMIAHALGLFGFDCLLYWFALVGAMALIWILLWKFYCKILRKILCKRFCKISYKRSHKARSPTSISIPFVPVEAISVLLAILLLLSNA